MQFVVFGKLADQYNGKPPAELQDMLQGEYAKSREYYAKGLLRHIWLFEGNQGIMSIFEADSRAQMNALLTDRGSRKGSSRSMRTIEPYSGFFPDLVT
jgi:muconolactone delta-isomerase